ncbi:MAG: UDP-glucose 4-epimerase GalE [Faecousia sp.]
MTVFVTGGAGFIGSHTCVELLQAGFKVIIADDLSNASADVPEKIKKITGIAPIFYQGDVCDKSFLRSIFSAHSIDAVIHFAGFKAVGESCRIPLQYYRNNLDSLMSVVETMEDFGCKCLVFSSSATVYGPENPVPYEETMPAYIATNPYGWTKLMIEQILRDYAAAHPDFSVILLRYFNPIGAHPSGLLGDDPNGIPNNLMPYVARVAAGILPQLTVFGDDYDTPDGTCLRDYLHVVDLAKGHLKAIDYASAHTGIEAVNLGTGNGVSVLELVHAFERATGVKVPYVIGPRREGDLACCWANADKAKTLFGWTADMTLEEMCRDSWNFVQSAEKAK